MPGSSLRGKAPGGAPRPVLKSRSGSSTSSLRRLSDDGAGSATSSQARSAKPPQQASTSVAAASVATATPCAPVKKTSFKPANKSDVTSQADGDNTTAQPTHVRPTSGEGNVAGRYNTDAAALPPWSCILAPKIRYQPNTLVWRVNELPKGIAEACATLDQRRYQPTSAEHGLAFRLRDAVPGGSTSTLNRIRPEDERLREGVATPQLEKWAAPGWWGCGPKKIGNDKLAATYEDLGMNWQEDGFPLKTLIQKSVSTPLINGKYDHFNPFMSHFSKRSDGGVIVCDVSVAGKAGPSKRDPKLGRGK